VDPNLLYPPTSQSAPFPLDSTISISPDAGHYPNSLFFGRSQIAGHNQSPTGSLALISTVPYLNAKDSADLILAL